ncbi:hypothetical protein IMY05_017G0041900 [Salix suchowensis]|nr:hypothetical protein IMY05_017G0041900 [Salix suchowensis]
MARCFSFTAYPERIHRYSFSKAGPLSLSSNLGDGKIIHCWAQCVMRLAMEGFVGYSMAAQFQEKIERVGVPPFFLTDVIDARLNIGKKIPDILSDRLCEQIMSRRRGN